MKEYNMKYINDYSTYIYEKYLKSKIQLFELSKNYLDRFEFEKEISGEKILKKESLDHYMVKKLIEKKEYIKEFRKEHEKYLNYLYNLIIKTNGLETHTNCFLIYIIKNNLISSFYDKNKTKQILKLHETNKIKIEEIIKRINGNLKITQKELNYISIYFGTKRDLSDSNYQKFLSYIFTNLHNSKKLKCQEETLCAIINYLPNELNEPNINGEDLRIVLSNIETSCIARYNQNTNHPYLNRLFFKNIDFINVDSINKTYKKRQEKMDFIYMLVISYHELYHLIQHIKSKQEKYSYEGVIYANRLILDSELSDYKDNHDNEQIEIEATIKAWNMVKIILNKFLHTKDSKYLQKKCLLNELGTKARRPIAKKKDIFCNEQHMIDYDISKISYFIKRDPNLLDLYPILKNIYDNEGKIKLSLVELNYQDPIINGYIEYMLNNKMLLTDKAYNQVFKNKTNIEINKILNNIFNVIRQNILYINLINNMIEYNLYGDYQTDVSLEYLNETKKKYLLNLYNNYIEFLNIISFIKEKSNLNIDSFWYSELSQSIIDILNKNKDIDLEQEISKLKLLTRQKD